MAEMIRAVPGSNKDEVQGRVKEDAVTAVIRLRGGAAHGHLFAVEVDRHGKLPPTYDVTVAVPLDWGLVGDGEEPVTSMTLTYRRVEADREPDGAWLYAIVVEP